MVDTPHSERRLPPLVLRADANARIGSGHLMRCVALGQAWKDGGGEVHFVTACTNGHLLNLLHQENFAVYLLGFPHPEPQDLRTTGLALTRDPDAWLALDGYHFDAPYQKLLKEGGHRLMVIDDLADLPHYYADAVLNQNIHAENQRYQAEPDTRLFLGTKYVLLRRDFREWRGKRSAIPEVARKILVTLGGGDPDNATLKVIRAIQHVPVDDLAITILVGASNPHYNELQAAVKNSRADIRLETHVTDMPRLMSCADIAISGAGTTCWEMAFMGLPSLLIVLAKNQRPIAEGLDADGAARNLGWQQNLSPVEIGEALTFILKSVETRSEMARLGRKLVDGKGTLRVIRAMTELGVP